MVRVYLKQAKSFRYHGSCSYLVSYDYSSGRKDRYEVYLLSSEDPVVIGRELPLSSVRKVIADHEDVAKDMFYIGERSMAIEIAKSVIQNRMQSQSKR